MATRSTIAIKNEDASIDAIYCHSDGYPSWTGQKLLDHYNNEDAARAIINLGSLSLLHNHLEPQAEFAISSRAYRIGTESVRHSFDTPHANVTVAYHRDRGEELQIDHYPNEDEWRETDYWDQYKYIWKDGAWYMIYQEYDRQYNFIGYKEQKLTQKVIDDE